MAGQVKGGFVEKEEQPIHHIIQFAKDAPDPWGPWIPVIQAAIFPALLVIAYFIYRRHVNDVVKSLAERIKNGAAFNLGMFSIGEAPEALQNADTGTAAVSDPGGGQVLPEPAIVEGLSDLYRDTVEGYVLLHASKVEKPRTSPRSGRYYVRVWVEPYDSRRTLLADIQRVTYRLHETFQPNTISTESLETNFDLWILVYGEFSVVAYIEFKDRTKPPLTLRRYLDLPGRPPD